MLQVLPVPAFDDNYIWLLRGGTGSNCAVVDPGDAEPVIDELETEGGSLSAILITHLHGDHTGGIRELKARWPQAVVYGPAGEPIPTLERRLGEGDEVELADIGARFRVLDVPGHTGGHIAYFGEGCLFCGDTLFAGGCGRVFSGTHEQLSASLEKIAALPADTRVYCAHEYTLANLGFARWVEPESPVLAERLVADRATREQGQPTVPSTLELELATNPFLRTDRPGVIAAAEHWQGESLPTRAAVFRALRTWKDRDYD